MTVTRFMYRFGYVIATYRFHGSMTCGRIILSLTQKMQKHENKVVKVGCFVGNYLGYAWRSYSYVIVSHTTYYNNVLIKVQEL